MKTNTLLSLIAVASLALSSAASAGGVKTYQVTGPVIEINDNIIVVEKSKGKNERWEIARDSSSKVPTDVKVGDKVTVHYTMTATEVEAKPTKGAKNEKMGAAQKKE